MKTQFSQSKLATSFSAHRRTWLLLIIVLLVLLTVVANLRFLSGEDDWMCKDGRWVQHGHPSSPMPAGACK